MIYDCKTCRCWVVDSTNSMEGECRKKSPTAAMNSEGNVSCVWPVTSYNDFCSEHEVDQAKIIKNLTSDDDLKKFVSDVLETQVTNLELERGENGTYIMGRITINTEPTKEDCETIARYLGEDYEEVDISIIGD